MQKLIFYLIICVVTHARSDFEIFGDTFTLMPVPVGVVSESMEDYWGAFQLLLGTAATQGAIEGIKSGFNLAHKNGYSIAFAKRPCCDSYKGMPSGHAGGAMSAAGYVFYRYGWKPALPLIALSVATSASRVYAEKHSVWQVLVGSAIAWGFAALFTTPYSEFVDNSAFGVAYRNTYHSAPRRQFFVFPSVGRDRAYRIFYYVSVSYVF
ncbi:phosphatase PAP2 family protein [Helicobacter sp. 23-1044]